MPPRKRVKSKKPTTSSSEGEELNAGVKATFNIASTTINEPDQVHYVTLDLRMLNWSYLNFKFCTKTTTRLFAIKQRIKKQHGPIINLKICKEQFSESNELRNDMMTLAEYGIEGAAEGEPEMVCLIHYDFKPEQHDNPLLLAERN